MKKRKGYVRCRTKEEAEQLSREWHSRLWNTLWTNKPGEYLNPGAYWVHPFRPAR